MKSAIAKPLALVCGAGSGLGVAIANTFSDAGYQVVGFNRSAPQAMPKGSVLRQLDCSDPVSTQTMMTEIVDQFGSPRVYIHNPAHLVIEPFLNTSTDEYEASWRSMALSVRECIRLVLRIGSVYRGMKLLGLAQNQRGLITTQTDIWRAL